MHRKLQRSVTLTRKSRIVRPCESINVCALLKELLTSGTKVLPASPARYKKTRTRRSVSLLEL